MNPLAIAIILGIVQGVTEFLPISSSGHLVLLQHFLPVDGDDLAFDLVLHLGTLVPVIVIFWDDLIKMITDPLQGEGPFLERPGTRWLMWVIVASIPTAIMGLALEKLFESLLSGYLSLAWQFAITAVALQTTAKATPGQRGVEDMTWKDALIIGIAQGIAVVPAISRSGSTIVAAILLGMRRDVAGRFSFVISVPAILGAVILKARKVTYDPELFPAWVLGGLTALVFGWISLKFLVQVIRGGNFAKFSWYCWGAAAVSLAFGLFL